MARTKFDYSLDYKNINMRDSPNMYCIGKGEQGVLMVEPYKSEILPYWKFKNLELAHKSAVKIYDLFLVYKSQDDFVGMDMARKFLQMGYTRSRRYANHSSGHKYSKTNLVQKKEIRKIPDYGSEKNRDHYIITKTKQVLPQETDFLSNEKAQCASIFYKYYKFAVDDLDYIRMKTTHQKKYD